MYKVVCDFIDLEDHNHRYTAGDSYPRSGLMVSVNRVNYLLSYKNKLHKPVIAHAEFAKVHEEQSSESVSDAIISPDSKEVDKVIEKKYSKTEIMRMNKQNLSELAKTLGIPKSDEMSGALLKAAIIGHYGL